MNTQSWQSVTARLVTALFIAVALLSSDASYAQSGNTATGSDALVSDISGNDNTADGAYALYQNTSGSGNTAVGLDAMFQNGTGYYNTAIGWEALTANVSGYYNAATGANALADNTTGYANVADGYGALLGNLTGMYNVATGYEAMYSNDNGSYNVADGVLALYSNTAGAGNTASGCQAAYLNTTGGDNTAYGAAALYYNATGSYNVAAGFEAAYNNVGSENTAIGNGALYSSVANQNTAVGMQALCNNTSGAANIALGYLAGYYVTTGNYNIDIGNGGSSSDSAVIRIGTPGTQTQTIIAGISGETASGGVEVFINANGVLGTTTSSRRFKKDIRNVGTLSERLMNLRPVTFRYKKAADDGSYPVQYGLIAEEVAKVCPELVQYDKQGKPFTVFYHQLTPLLLNELQREHRRGVALQTAVAAQNGKIAMQNAQIAALESELASVKEPQERQNKVLARLAAFAGVAQNTPTTQSAAR